MAKPPRYQAEEPFSIFLDESYGHPISMISHAPMPPAPKPARQPRQSPNANVVLNPPTANFVKQSPFKSHAQPSNAPLVPLNSTHGNKLNSVQMVPPNSFQHSTDSLEKKQPVMSRFKTVAQRPQPDFNMQFMGKENSHPLLYPAPAPSHFNLPLESYYQKPTGKRALMDAARIKELRPAKRQKFDDPVPAHDSFPRIIDDGTKPNHSYATLIGMAILRSPQRRLTLSQIYKWISDTYSFYGATDAGWQNSIRHNLSLNKHFIKQERPKDDPGKGNYWSIEPGAEQQFMKEKPSRKSATTAENMPVMSTRLEPSQPQPQPHAPHIPEPTLPAPAPMHQNSFPALPPPSSQQLAPAPLLPEISSDATIPASDTATIDESADRAAENELLNEPELYSPLPATMHSSPPIPKRMEARHSGTPPSHHQRAHASSATKSRSHRRKFVSMDDSGYISSLESSAMRPYQHNKLLTSEADRPRMKRGCAEEEIARLRASSYESPSKGRSYGYPPPSSSPLRQTSHSVAGQMLPPLTPAMKLKAPPKPPPSVSPSTNLRLHRQSIQSMVDSPFRRVSALLPETDFGGQLTPGFDIDQLWYDLERKTDDHDNTGFDIFDDAASFHSIFALTPHVAPNGSPAKRSVRKRQLERSQSAGALNDTTNMCHNASNPASFLKVPAHAPNLTIDTPSKVFAGLPSSPSKLFLDLPSPSKMPLINDENMDPWVSLDALGTPDFLEDNDFSGFDMLAGFEKIGASTA
ncbi:hypothetical protein BT67DRAFT_357701, partial [Trichocladium antarcticum]